MPPLQNLLHQSVQLSKGINSPLKNGVNRIKDYNNYNLRIINQLKNQNRILVSNFNPTIKQINNSGIKNANLVKSLNNVTKNIAPLTREANDVKISILKSMTYHRLPKEYYIKIQQIDNLKEKSKDIGTPTQKSLIVPVKLVKPLAALHQTAGAIQSATLTKPEEKDQVKLDFEPETKSVGSTEPEIIYDPKPTSVLAVPPARGSETVFELPEKEISTYEEPPSPQTTISPTKPVLIKDLAFLKPEPAPGKKVVEDDQIIEEEMLVKSDKHEDTIELESWKIIEDQSTADEPIISRKIESQAEIVTGPKSKITQSKVPNSKSILPIIDAIGLLTGIAAAAPVKPKIITPSQKKKIHTTPLKEMKINEIGKTRESIKTIPSPPPPKPKPSITEPAYDLETFEEIVPKAAISTEPDELKLEQTTPHREESEKEVIRTKPVLKSKPTMTSNWIPIVAAVSLVSGIAAAASDATNNLRSTKQQIVPKPGIKSVARKSIDIEKTQISPSDLKTVKTSQPVKEITKKPEMARQTQKETKIKTTMVKPIPTIASTTGALGLLSFIAKKSATPKNVIFKPLQRARHESELGAEPVIISKRMIVANANLPTQTTSAIDNLTIAASQSKSSLYIDNIKPDATKKSDSAIIFKQRFTPGQSSKIPKQVLTEPSLDIPPASEHEYNQIEPIKKPIPIKLKRSLIIGGGSIGALGLLSTIATTTASTRAEIYSKSPTLSTVLKNSYEPPSKLPKTGSNNISPEIYIKPPASVIIAQTRSKLTKPVSRDSVKALNILSAVALSAGQRQTTHTVSIPEVIIARREKVAKNKDKYPYKDLRQLTQTSLSSRTKSMKRDELIQSPLDPLALVTTKQFSSISEAIGLIQRPEKRLAKRLTHGQTIELIKGEEIEMGEALEKTKPQISRGSRPIYISSREGTGKEILSKKPTESDVQQVQLSTSKPPSSAYFDRIPPGAPVKKNLDRERMSDLEEQIQLLRKKISTKEGEQFPSNRKLQEVVHDPNLQTQLKKMFYEAWLENMDKELKRYGE